MIEYTISFLIGIIILLVGYHLSKLAYEEVMMGFKYFEYSLLILNPIIIFVLLYLLGFSRLIAYIIISLFLISLYYSKNIIGLIIHGTTYIISLFFIAKNPLEFLIALTIIYGFIISSKYYFISKIISKKQ